MISHVAEREFLRYVPPRARVGRVRHKSKIPVIDVPSPARKPIEVPKNRDPGEAN